MRLFEAMRRFRATRPRGFTAGAAIGLGVRSSTDTVILSAIRGLACSARNRPIASARQSPTHIQMAGSPEPAISLRVPLSLFGPVILSEESADFSGPCSGARPRLL